MGDWRSSFPSSHNRSAVAATKVLVTLAMRKPSSPFSGVFALPGSTVVSCAPSRERVETTICPCSAALACSSPMALARHRSSAKAGNASANKVNEAVSVASVFAVMSSPRGGMEVRDFYNAGAMRTSDVSHAWLHADGAGVAVRLRREVRAEPLHRVCKLLRGGAHALATLRIVARIVQRSALSSRAIEGR